MIEALQRLQQHLNDNYIRGRSYEILSFMAAECLARPHATEKLRFEAKALLTGCGTASEQVMDPKDWVPAIETMRRALRLAQAALPEPRLQLGYQAGGGRGNVSLYWLELVPDTETEEPESEIEPSATVRYRRTAKGDIRPSLPAALFMRDGELRNRSVRGITFLSSILLGSALWAAFFGVMLLSLGLREGPITMGSLITLCLSLAGFVFIWREVYSPWFRVIDDCVVKAPIWVTAFHELSCELEMYRHEKYRWTRLVRFSADCPICGSNIELRGGKPDQKYPLVGRCVESPHAHIYSFDRMTLRGTYLGPSLAPLSAQ